MRGSYVKIACSWVGSITENKLLSDWGSIEHGIQVEDVCKGEKIGFALPHAVYGEAGVLVSNFAKMRVFKAVKKRGNNWPEGHSEVLFVCDEAQAIITDEEANLFPVARSLGLMGLLATQNVEGIIAAFHGDEDKAYQLIGNLKSLIAFPTGTKKSNKLVSERAGYEWRSVVDRTNGMVDVQSEINATMNNSADHMVRNTYMRIEESNSAGLVKGVASKLNGFVGGTVGTVKDWFIETAENKAESEVEIRIEPLLIEDEIDSVLAKPYTAFMQLDRAGVKRRDVAQTTPFVVKEELKLALANAGE